jgi:hypothetical protein
MSKINPAVNDPEVLEMLYWQEGLSMHRIAERLGVAETTVYRRMEEYGIDRRGRAYNSVKNTKYQNQLAKYARYRVKSGYPVWEGNNNSDGFATTFVHQLLLVADGEDPHKVYSDEWHCHHLNGVRWDNRVENLELWTREEHGRYHTNQRDMEECGSWQKYDDEELLGWITAFIEEFDFVPTEKDVRGWPGPATATYRLRFGSFKDAVREAGYTPRTEQD